VVANDERTAGTVAEDIIMTLAVVGVVVVAWLLVSWIWLAMLVGYPVTIC